MTNTDDQYPNPMEALFGNGHVANLKCAIKYFTWHLGYLFLSIMMIIFGGLLLIGGFITNRAPDPSSLVGPRTKRAAKYGVYAWYALFAVYITLLFINHPFLFVVYMATVGLAVHVLFALYLIFNVYEEETKDVLSKIGLFYKQTNEKSAKTPVARRVLGKCPVSFDIEPKWFNKLFGP